MRIRDLPSRLARANEADAKPRATIGPVPWDSFVAIGDSFTEGLWDADPMRPDRCVGWADRLAGELSKRRVAAGDAPLQYANLAIRGKLARAITTEQLDQALSLHPALVSIVGGGNDLLRPDANVDRLAAMLERAVVRARRAGADVLLATGVDPVDSPGISLTRGKVGAYSACVWSIARRHEAHVLDVWGMRSLRSWSLWAPDRIHLTAEGHQRVMNAALVALGQPPADAEWDARPPAAPQRSLVEQARWNGEWVRDWVAPWMGRRLRRQSSGDGRSAKDAALRPLA